MLDGTPWQLAMHTLVVVVVSVVDIVAFVGIVVHLVVVVFLLMLCRHRRMLDDVGSYSRPSSLKQSPPHLRHGATQSLHGSWEKDKKVTKWSQQQPKGTQQR